MPLAPRRVFGGHFGHFACVAGGAPSDIGALGTSCRAARRATRAPGAGRERRAELADGVDHGVAIDVVNEYAAFGNNDAFAGGAGLVATVASWSHIKL